jgi:DNA-binding response OmpR family regulator
MTANRNDENQRQSLILIVDDVPENLQVLGTILEEENYEVALSANGQQTLDLIDDIQPDLILLDIMMPELDGFEVCRRLKKSAATEKIPIIFLTAKTDTDDIVKGFELGAADYVTKPFSAPELLARVHTHLELKKIAHERIQKEKLQGIIEMAGAVCHELNQPIQVSSINSELAMADIKEDNPVFDNIKTIKEQTDRMAAITRKLMRITKYETKDYLTGRIIDIEKAVE